MRKLAKLILLAVFIALPRLSFGQVAEFNWLMGSWETENKTMGEDWRQEGGTLKGVGYSMDTHGNKIVNEEIKLIKAGGDFFYVPDVAGPQPFVRFKITSYTVNNFTAENPAHDFPTKIIYERSGKRLDAMVSGKGKSIHYVFRKIK